MPTSTDQWHSHRSDPDSHTHTSVVIQLEAWTHQVLRRGPNLFERAAIKVHDTLHGAADKFVDQHPAVAQATVDGSGDMRDEFIAAARQLAETISAS